MPEMDGFELLTELRRQDQWRSIPVIVATSKDLTEEERQYLNGYVGKIFQKGNQDHQALMDEIHRLVSEAVSRKLTEQRNGSLPVGQNS